MLLIDTALWLLCMFAAVVFAAQPDAVHAENREAWWLAPVGAVLTLGLTRWLPVQPQWVGLVIASAAIWALLRGTSVRAVCALSGSSGALAAAVYAARGLPSWLAVLLGAGLIYLSARCAGRAGFVSSQMHQQALLGLAWAAPCVAAAPGVIEGWQSAQALNTSFATAASHAVPFWSWQLLCAALLLGLLRGLWVRK